MKIRNTLTATLLMSLLALTSCGGKQGEAQNHLRQHLKDPDSLEVLESSEKKLDEHVCFKIKYKAKNKNGACGLYQAYPCKKMKKFGKNYKTSYKVQTKWGLNYIYYRYGSPVNAWNFWQKHHWY